MFSSSFLNPLKYIMRQFSIGIRLLLILITHFLEQAHSVTPESGSKDG